MDISHRLQTIIKASPHQRERLAAALSVSASTIDRWATGSVTPTPKHLTALREVLTDLQGPATQEPLLRALGQSLTKAREVMHSHGAASSRNDALDQISLLLSAHLQLRRAGKDGLQRAAQDQLAPTLLQAVDDLRDQMPQAVHDGLVHSAKQIAGKLRYLRELVFALQAALDEIDSSEDRRRPHDLHEVFVNFLASSFHEEKEFAQYMTPREVVDFMVRVAMSLHAGRDRAPVVLDPSCGTASFLTSFAELYAERLELSEGPERKARWLNEEAAHHLIGIDTSERMVRLATTSFVAADIEPRKLFLDSSLEPTGADAQAALSDGSVDLILTNPPFGAEHSRGRHGGGRVPSEVIYVERYAGWLRAGGYALSIVPDSVLTNKGMFADLRSRLTDLVDLIAVVSLPPITFAASGTTTKTSILVFRKKNGSEHPPTLFSVANHVGFEVSTRGSIRKRIAHPRNDLPAIADAIIFGGGSDVAIARNVDPSLGRWDAQFVSSPLAAPEENRTGAGERVLIGSVASVVKERADPRVSGATFDYIEISNVDGDLLRVSATPTPTAEAPSRARRRVRAGDVLVSTVRPERRTIGVVPPHLDGAICSTGFAVLRPTQIPPYALAAALRAPNVTAQLVGISSGVAYPAFDGDALPTVAIDVGDAESQANCSDYGSALEALEVRRRALFAT